VFKERRHGIPHAVPGATHLVDSVHDGEVRREEKCVVERSVCGGMLNVRKIDRRISILRRKGLQVVVSSILVETS
jgi:hypothetical protein